MKYGFIGCGNMGSAIAGALVTGNVDFAVSDRSGKAKDLGFPYCTPQEVAQQADRLFLAVKPQMMADVLAELAPILARRRPVLISMAAGLTMGRIASMAGGSYPVIRIMPNTPARIGQGVIQYDWNDRCQKADVEQFLSVLGAAGHVSHLPERLIDAGSAVSGSGPAFAAMFIEAMADGGVICGLPRATAMEYAARTLIGTAELMLQSGDHPGKMKDAVCSPGGSTIQGVRALEKGGFRSAVTEAIVATWEKNKEFAK